MTPDQVRFARKLLGWSRDKLAVMCDVPKAQLQRYENGLPIRGNAVAKLSALRTTLEAAGVEFTDGDAPGVRLRGRVEAP